MAADPGDVPKRRHPRPRGYSGPGPCRVTHRGELRKQAAPVVAPIPVLIFPAPFHRVVVEHRGEPTPWIDREQEGDTAREMRLRAGVAEHGYPIRRVLHVDMHDHEVRGNEVAQLLRGLRVTPLRA